MPSFIVWGGGKAPIRKVLLPVLLALKKRAVARGAVLTVEDSTGVDADWIERGVDVVVAFIAWKKTDKSEPESDSRYCSSH